MFFIDLLLWRKYFLNFDDLNYLCVLVYFSVCQERKRGRETEFIYAVYMLFLYVILTMSTIECLRKHHYK